MNSSLCYSRLSAPHISLVRSVSEKLWLKPLTTFMPKGAFCNVTVELVSRRTERPSQLSKKIVGTARYLERYGNIVAYY